MIQRIHALFFSQVIFFMDFTILNHHWTTIWEDMFKHFSNLLKQIYTEVFTFYWAFLEIEGKSAVKRTGHQQKVPGKEASLLTNQYTL